ncbi:MAG TPA: hypothetical protein VL134_12365, partial [Leptolyngbya sp.]|nr:hypothetical protein [Leptolyngbya sp.]
MTLQLHLHQTIRESSISVSLRQVFTQTDSYATNQLAAEFWIERFLNHLNDRLQGCLNAAPTVAQLWQILADELGQALAGEGIAIALDSSEAATLSIDQFEIQHCAGSIMQLSSSIGAAPVVELGQIFTIAQLNQMRQSEWQSAWELRDRQTTYGWLVTTSSPVSATPADQTLLQLRNQCVSRAICQTVEMIRSAKKT